MQVVVMDVERATEVGRQKQALRKESGPIPVAGQIRHSWRRVSSGVLGSEGARSGPEHQKGEAKGAGSRERNGSREDKTRDDQVESDASEWIPRADDRLRSTEVKAGVPHHVRHPSDGQRRRPSQSEPGNAPEDRHTCRLEREPSAIRGRQGQPHIDERGDEQPQAEDADLAVATPPADGDREERAQDGAYQDGLKHALPLQLAFFPRRRRSGGTLLSRRPECDLMPAC